MCARLTKNAKHCHNAPRTRSAGLYQERCVRTRVRASRWVKVDTFLASKFIFRLLYPPQIRSKGFRESETKQKLRLKQEQVSQNPCYSSVIQFINKKYLHWKWPEYSKLFCSDMEKVRKILKPKSVTKDDKYS